MSFEMLFAVAVASGVFSSIITVTYQIGDNHRIYPCHIAMFMGFAGIAVFSLQAALISEPSALSAPPSVWILGLVSGMTQGLTILLLRLSFSRGPYSPILCSIRIMFVAVALFSVAFLSEKLSAMQYAGIAAAVACVVASVYTKTTRSLPNGSSGGGKIIFLILLLAIMVSQAIMGISMKYLNAAALDETKSLLKHFDSLFLASMYVGFTATVIAEGILVGKPAGRLTTLFWLGISAALGSVTATKALAVSSALPAGLNFVLSAVVGILASSVVSTLFFGDRRNIAFYATVTLAMLSALLMNLQPGTP